METIDLKIVRKPVSLSVDPERMLLWVLRSDLGLTGTKYGGGEPAITVVGAVIGNALFDAAGVRLFQVPLTPARVKEALGKIRQGAAGS